VSEVFKVWQCIGCGRIDGPQPCVGICQDRKAELVYASEYEEQFWRAEKAEERVAALEALVRRLAWTTPRAGEWERSYRELQRAARDALRAADSVDASVPRADQRGSTLLRDRSQ
jgi:uncharacterized membrane protein